MEDFFEFPVIRESFDEVVVETKFVLHNQRVNFEQAVEHCASLNTSIARIDTDTEFGHIVRTVDEEEIDTSFWIGLETVFDVGNTTGITPLIFEYSDGVQDNLDFLGTINGELPWAIVEENKPEPNNFRGDSENCVE